MTVRKMILSLSCLAFMAIGLTAGLANAKSTFDQEIALITRLLDAKPGSTLADIGAGDGAYAIALAQQVGASGRVYATELDAQDRDKIAEAADDSEIEQIVVATAELAATGLPPSSCDAVLLRNVYHHLTEPKDFTASLFETIRPGGRLLVIDFPDAFWLGLWKPDGLPDDRTGHGVKPEIVIQELEAVGFKRIESIDPWPSAGFFTKDYAIVFERP